MKKLLWIGDAVASTGFARCTHNILDVLRRDWNIYVLGLNYNGDPHEYPYSIYPAWAGGDAFGVGRTEMLVNAINPDVVVIQNDPWNIPAYMAAIRKASKTVPVVAVLAVDGKNCKGVALNDLALGIFWTEFGLNEARLGGFDGNGTVIPLGVDLSVYYPVDKVEARVQANIPLSSDAFIVGNINRNQPRKRFDLTIEYFAEWVKRFQVDNAFLYLHTAPTGEDAYDVHQLMHYYGFRGKNKRLLMGHIDAGYGVDEAAMRLVYSCADVHLSTTQGEGWGLTTMEGMACSVPQIVPDWAALGEWPKDTVLKTTCTSHAVTLRRINVIGGVADKEETVSALQMMYQDASLRYNFGEAGRELVSDPKYRWPAIGEAYLNALKVLA